MFEYEFYRIEIKTSLRERKPVEDYHRIVEQYASEGWRLVQIFAPSIKGYGSAEYYELVFEKQK